MLNCFLKVLMDVCILGLRVRVLKLRTDNIVLLGGNVGENLKEIGQGGDKDRGGWSDGDDGLPGGRQED